MTLGPGVDIALARGAYALRGLEIVKPGVESAPLLLVDRTDVSVQWNELLRSKLVGEIEFRPPRLNLVQGTSDRESQLGTASTGPPP